MAMRKLYCHGRVFPIVSLIAILLATLLQAIPALPARAQNAPPVQEILGKINPGELDVFRLPGLQKGQTIYISLETTSGNLDPALSLVPASVDLPQLIADYRAEVLRLMQTAEHPLVELPTLNDNTFLAWDDDSGPGYDAALGFVVPQDGDYILGASGSLSSAGRITSGSYRLLLGIDAPDVVAGTAVPNGATIAIQDESLLGSQGRVQEYTGKLDASKPSTTLEFYDFDPGETLSVFIEATSGDLKPVIVLRDYGGKPVRLGNLQGSDTQTSLEYAFPEGGEAYTLEINAAPKGKPATSGDFRLLTGVDAPEVMAGAAQPNSQEVLRLAIPVQVGFKLQQIIAIDQQNEIMKAVGTIKLEWTDPALAFSPDECNCQVKEYNESNFNKFLESAESWPDFTFFNQQANRWTQNRLVEIRQDGHTTYLERFTTDFQLNFDFQQYPFDFENFYIYVDMLNPENQYYLVPMEGFSEIDPQNGEDEFILGDFDTSVESVISSRVFPTSRYSFHFGAPRHLEYYIFRVFIPILLIIGISYITFFLKDFTRRIEVATGNVLLFIAFSWSLAEDYPRMGYLTFLDAIMAITFIINTLVVMYNVYLKWLENKDQRERAERIDRVADWIYPIGYLVCFGITYIIFFVI